MNEQIKQAIDKFKIPRPKVTIGEGLESAYLIPKSELLSLLKLMAGDAWKESDILMPKAWKGETQKYKWKSFEDYWKTLTKQL